MKFRPEIGPAPQRKGFVEEQINASIARGDFDNLKDKGQPLPDPPDLAKPEAMRQKLRSDASFGAPWANVAEEIEDAQSKIEREIIIAREFRDAGKRSRRSDPASVEADYRRRLRQIEKLIEAANSLILKNNLLVPRELPHLHRKRLKLEDFPARDEQEWR